MDFCRLIFFSVRSLLKVASRQFAFGIELFLVCLREYGECISRARSLSCTKNRDPDLGSLSRGVTLKGRCSLGISRHRKCICSTNKSILDAPLY
jgi:hypothetical protein